MNPEDAADRGIHQDDLVWARSRRGKSLTRANINERIQKGMVFMTYQWWIGKCNNLTEHVVDPLSGTPEDKHSACQVDAIPDQKWGEQELARQVKAMKDMLEDEAAPQNVDPVSTQA